MSQANFNFSFSSALVASCMIRKPCEERVCIETQAPEERI